MERQIGVLYSTVTGIILRIVNPDRDANNDHLDWLDNNKPEGTTLYRADKSKVIANHYNTPNMAKMIDYAKKKDNLVLREGEVHAVIDSKDEVVDVVICCPALYKKRLKKIKKKDRKKDYYIIKKQGAFVGQKYDKTLKKFKTQKKDKSWVYEDKWVSFKEKDD